MENRRQHVTPFKADDSAVTCAADQPIAVAETPEIAAFIARACSRYDALMAMFDLCRGEMEGITLPYRSPHHKAFGALARELLDDIQIHGR